MSTSHAYADRLDPLEETSSPSRPRTRPLVKVVPACRRIVEPADESGPKRVAPGDVGSGGAGSKAAAREREHARTRPEEALARRWRHFLSLAAAHGIAAEEAAAGFTDDDIADLCAPEHDDETLDRCMATLAASVRREHARLDAALDATWPAPLGGEPFGGASGAAAPTVRCADCRHFRRRASHPRLGGCAAGVVPTASGGFWDDQRRGCETFAAGPAR